MQWNRRCDLIEANWIKKAKEGVFDGFKFGCMNTYIAKIIGKTWCLYGKRAKNYKFWRLLWQTRSITVLSWYSLFSKIWDWSLYGYARRIEFLKGSRSRVWDFERFEVFDECLVLNYVQWTIHCGCAIGYTILSLVVTNGWVSYLRTPPACFPIVTCVLLS